MRDGNEISNNSKWRLLELSKINHDVTSHFQLHAKYVCLIICIAKSTLGNREQYEASHTKGIEPLVRAY